MSMVLSSLNKRLDRHFVACAAAAAAAGVTGLSASESQAAIVYSGPLNYHVIPSTPAGVYIQVSNFNIQVTGAANPAWNLNVFNIFYTGNYTGVAFYPHTAGTDRVVGNGQVGVVAKLAANAAIGPASPLMALNSNGIGAFQVFYPNGTDFGLPWQDDGSQGFMGFKVTFADASVHFGWLRAQIDPWSAANGTPGSAPVTIIDMAYEDTPNTAILAGATGGAVPEPASAIALGLLALGAAGIRPSRRSDA